MKKLLLFLLIIQSLFAQAQWNNKQAAIVLTYDDGLDEDLTNVIPALDSANLKGTFYVSDYLNHLQEKAPEWKKAAMNGHELGNHTLKHPCAGGTGREFVKPDNDLNTLTFNTLKQDILKLEKFLRSLDGKQNRSFAYPCGDQKVEGTINYIDSFKTYFNSSRGVSAGMPTNPKDVNLYDVKCYSMAGQTGDEMIALVKEAISKKALLVFLFHGVGAGHSLNVSLEAHSQLVHFLKANQKELWIAPMVDVAEYIKKHN